MSWFLIILFVVGVTVCALLEGSALWAFAKLEQLGQNPKHRKSYLVISSVMIAAVSITAVVIVYLNRVEVVEGIKALMD
ncbi:MAG: hypothetical protein AAFX76_14000 [Planctomycetota bacterium]